MAFQLTSIGAAQPAGSAALPGALKAVHPIGKGLNFAAKLDRKLLDLTDNQDVLSQIAALLQNGTPMATLVDRVARQLTDALSRAAGNSSNVDAKTRSTLERALAGALAPPGTSPPQSNGELAAALEQRLKHLLSTLTSTPATAGQQNELSGNILDADSAKETPAQQKESTSTGAPADALNRFAQALLQQAAGNAQVQTGTPAPSTAAVTTTAAPMPAPTAPDILTRILARAANADVQRSGHAAQTSTKPAAEANTTASAAGKSATTAPSTLFERLIAIVAEHGNAHTDANADQQFARNSAPEQPASAVVTSSHQAQANLTAAPAFSTQVASATASAVPAQSASSLQHSAIDPHAIIEQVVKGITMRTSGSTSEVRMRLQPDHLGDVALKLTVTGNTITASLVAQNAHVRDLLLGSQQQLARSLSDAGLSLGNFSVDVSGGNGGFNQQQAQQQRASVRPGAFDVGLAGEEGQWIDPRFGPSLVPAGKSLVLNYLV